MPPNGGTDEDAIRKRMRDRLADLRVTQEQLASAIGEKLKNVNRWLTGTKMPAHFIAAYVAKVDVNPAWLITGVGLPSRLPEEAARARLAEIREIVLRPVPNNGTTSADEVEEDRAVSNHAPNQAEVPNQTGEKTA